MKEIVSKAKSARRQGLGVPGSVVPEQDRGQDHVNSGRHRGGLLGKRALLSEEVHWRSALSR